MCTLALCKSRFAQVKCLRRVLLSQTGLKVLHRLVVMKFGNNLICLVAAALRKVFIIEDCSALHRAFFSFHRITRGRPLVTKKLSWKSLNKKQDEVKYTIGIVYVIIVIKKGDKMLYAASVS